VKNEDIDWLIYHLLVPQETAAPADLAAKTGLDLMSVTESLQRLEKYLLIELIDGRVRLLSFGDSLIRCQVRHEPDLPYTIENGVIRPKSKD
jgi:Mn-dependent DtxR family transcriptional regulator